MYVRTGALSWDLLLLTTSPDTGTGLFERRQTKTPVTLILSLYGNILFRNHLERN